VRNTALVVLVALPAIAFARYLRSPECAATEARGGPAALPWPLGGGALSLLAQPAWWCAFGRQQPLLAANLVRGRP
jgi:hypothetical protein